MIEVNKIKEIFENSDGILKTADLLAANIYYKDIKRLMADGYIEKIRYGYYHWVHDKVISEAQIISRFFPDGILCMNTALFYYRYSDRTPLHWDIAVSKNSGKSRFHIDYPFVKPYYVEPELLNIGLVEGEIDGYPVRIYNKERVICDCIRYANKMDKEIFNKAIQSYINDAGKHIPNLVEYAKQLRTLKKVKDLLGVWL